jgi:hypothetical protein
LVLSGGKLYGTTYYGGDYGYGVVFGLADVTGLPIITASPASQTVPPLGTANFSVSATGDAPLAYQWLFNNAAIAGATNSSLSLPGVTVGLQGNYSVVAYNNLGSAFSQPATLTVGVAGYNHITGQLLSGGNMRLSFVGNAGASYALDRTFNLKPVINWVPQATNPADGNGILVFTNATNPGTNNFWRIRSVP